MWTGLRGGKAERKENEKPRGKVRTKEEAREREENTSLTYVTIAGNQGIGHTNALKRTLSQEIA